jgi:hypothetical protein
MPTVVRMVVPQVIGPGATLGLNSKDQSLTLTISKLPHTVGAPHVPGIRVRPRIVC